MVFFPLFFLTNPVFLYNLDVVAAKIIVTVNFKIL